MAVFLIIHFPRNTFVNILVLHECLAIAKQLHNVTDLEFWTWSRNFRVLPYLHPAKCHHLKSGIILSYLNYPETFWNGGECCWGDFSTVQRFCPIQLFLQYSKGRALYEAILLFHNTNFTHIYCQQRHLVQSTEASYSQTT